MINKNEIIKANNNSGKFVINESYRPIAKALKNKYKELEYVPINQILFVDNTEDKRKKNNKPVYAQIGKVPAKWEEIIYQTTGIHFDYILEVFRENTIDMSREQIIALLYHELRHIQLIKTEKAQKIDIISHDIEDWANMFSKLGQNWATTKALIPDLLADGIDWENIIGPPSLFSEESTLRLVK
jgi:predicted metallopeptidase